MTAGGDMAAKSLPFSRSEYGCLECRKGLPYGCMAAIGHHTFLAVEKYHSAIEFPAYVMSRQFLAFRSFSA